MAIFILGQTPTLKALACCQLKIAIKKTKLSTERFHDSQVIKTNKF